VERLGSWYSHPRDKNKYVARVDGIRKKASAKID